MSHYIEKCKVCEKVMSQCKCPDLNKSTIYSICEDCKNKKSKGKKK